MTLFNRIPVELKGGSSRTLGVFPQRYENSHGDRANSLGDEAFRRSAAPEFTRCGGPVIWGAGSRVPPRLLLTYALRVLDPGRDSLGGQGPPQSLFGPEN